MEHPPIHAVPASGADTYRVADYLVVPSARSIEKAREPVALGGRAFDLLVFLLERRGQIIGKEEILRHVWPNAHVTEGCLRFQIANLRRALAGTGSLIKTVSGRGYMLATDRS